MQGLKYLGHKNINSTVTANKNVTDQNVLIIVKYAC